MPKFILTNKKTNEKKVIYAKTWREAYKKSYLFSKNYENTHILRKM